MAKKDQIETEIPKSTAARSAKMVSIPVGLAGRGVLGLGKQLVGQSSSVVITDIQEKTAEQLFKVLGELKGGAMKFGQALSVFEAALPENIAKPYRETLTKLQESAPPLPTRVVHKVLAKELGEDWRDNFTSFEDKATASASIGQVHKGVWKDALVLQRGIRPSRFGVSTLGVRVIKRPQTAEHLEGVITWQR